MLGDKWPSTAGLKSFTGDSASAVPIVDLPQIHMAKWTLVVNTFSSVCSIFGTRSGRGHGQQKRTALVSRRNVVEVFKPNSEAFTIMHTALKLQFSCVQILSVQIWRHQFPHDRRRLLPLVRSGEWGAQRMNLYHGMPESTSREER